MKQNNDGAWSCSRINNGFTVVVFVAFLVLMSCSSSASAARALLLSTTPSAIVNLAGAKSIQYINHHDAATAAASSADFSDLMGGFEECDEKDKEECEKRRMVAEAHLDYIYTQNHKHP